MAATRHVELKVTDFRGDPAEAAAFVSRCWSAQFPETVSCSQWDANDFAWQVFAQPENIILGAYAGADLVGFVYGEPVDVLWRGRPVRAMFSSVLAVDPAWKGKGIAKALAQTLAGRMRAADLAFIFGFAVPGSGSLGPKFWQGSQGALRAVGIRPWIRPLNSRALATAAGAPAERIAARFAAATGFGGPPHGAVDGVRPYEPHDLDTCRALLMQAESDADLRYDWTPERLALQLSFRGIPSTWVYDDGTVRGFVNVHPVRLRGRAPFSAGQINHLVADPPAQRVSAVLMRAALQGIAAAGHALAICPDSSSATLPTLLRTGFLPFVRRYDCLFLFNAPQLDLSDLKRVKLQLR
ncbi:GNAT family N-acetyltransferase [Sinisalibacter lacisalsi]|uniref:N-acetyltransferase domain-containing protein n=1 Tax=Sinisalibacter lacisalsi TaxID=1526570 RepID=A0ABQ1QN95_9RHOB|nr:GNAT family N-acetyltransferase [Sinisalibacter lacisalsi]GGD34153.1 hypothetical protein GCM10011358_17760 [Sinisalibacter lacisalsi]